MKNQNRIFDDTTRKSKSIIIGKKIKLETTSRINKKEWFKKLLSIFIKRSWSKTYNISDFHMMIYDVKNYKKMITQIFYIFLEFW